MFGSADSPEEIVARIRSGVDCLDRIFLIEADPRSIYFANAGRKESGADFSDHVRRLPGRTWLAGSYRTCKAGGSGRALTRCGRQRSQPPRVRPRRPLHRCTTQHPVSRRDLYRNSSPRAPPRPSWSETSWAPYPTRDLRMPLATGRAVRAESVRRERKPDPRREWLLASHFEDATAVLAPSVAKVSSIPHGNVAVVQGQLPDRQNGVSLIPSPAPATVMLISSVPGLLKPTGPLAQEFIDDVASCVRPRLTADHTGLLWELKLASTEASVANIEFLTANARVTSVQSTLDLQPGHQG